MTSFSGLLSLHAETSYSTFHWTLAARLLSSYFYITWPKWRRRKRIRLNCDWLILKVTSPHYPVTLNCTWYFRLGVETAHLQVYSLTVGWPELDRGREILWTNRGRTLTKYSNSKGKPMGHRQNPSDSSNNRILQVLDWSFRFWSRGNFSMEWWHQ